MAKTLAIDEYFGKSSTHRGEAAFGKSSTHRGEATFGESSERQSVTSPRTPPLR